MPEDSLTDTRKQTILDQIEKIQLLDLSDVKDKVLVVTVGTDHKPTSAEDMQGVQDFLEAYFLGIGLNVLVHDHAVRLGLQDSKQVYGGIPEGVTVLEENGQVSYLNPPGYLSKNPS
jgi:hypothetical protein